MLFMTRAVHLVEQFYQALPRTFASTLTCTATRYARETGLRSPERIVGAIVQYKAAE